jgi:endo-1,4-beta-xylanase
MTDSPTRPRRRLRLWAPWLAAAVVAAAGAVVFTTPSSAAGPLRNAAAGIGKQIGYAANTDLLCNGTATCTSGQNATYRNLGQTEFNQVTPENVMKWETIEPNPNDFRFTQADGLVANAHANNQVVHGHTILWHQQAPGWLQSLSGQAMKDALQRHITNVIGRWANDSAVQSWDIANEVIGDGTGQLRQDFWTSNYPGGGSTYIADAFRMARAADSNVDLCINDYSIEAMNQKSNALFSLVQSLLQQGVPITCVGFQTHLIIGTVPGDFVANMNRFANLGLKIRISELDLRIPLPADGNELQQQARDYTTVVNDCRAVVQGRCFAITIWGIDDGHSWLPNSCCPEGAPLLWDAGFAQKPAYNSTLTALGGNTSSTTTTTTSRPPTTTTSRPPTTTTSTTTTSTTTTSSNPPGGCTGTPSVVNFWPQGFQGQVVVTNTGATTSSWRIVLTFAGGQTVNQAWGGRLASTTTPVPSPVTINNETWNNVLAPGATATVGYIANGSSTPLPTVTCSRTP